MESSLKLKSMPTFCRFAILQVETSVMNEGLGKICSISFSQKISIEFF